MAKILIIEDDADIAAIERDYLILSGYEVTVCTDGVSGLTAALDQDFDLLLLDLMLPEMDGFTICRKIREQRDIPILMVTALGKDVDKIRGLGYGADDYIEKPFSPQCTGGPGQGSPGPIPAAEAPGGEKGGADGRSPDGGHRQPPGHQKRRGNTTEKQGIRAAAVSHAPSGPGVQPGGSVRDDLGPRVSG